MSEQDRERLVGAIMSRAQDELARRRQANSFGLRLIRDLDGRSAPLAAAAAVIALVSTFAMMWLGVGVDAIEAQVPTLAEAIAPDAYAEWMVSEEHPAVSALMVEFDMGAQR